MSNDWKDVMEEFRERQAQARAMGPPDRLERQHAGGRRDARQRIDALVDAGSFTELGTLVGGIARDGLPATPSDAVVGGLAMLDNRPVVVVSEDFTVQGGSIGIGGHAKRVRFAGLALQERIPLVLMLEGAGERATNALQRYPYAPNDLQVLAELKGQVPTVALIMGASAGHGAISGLLLDFVVMVDGAALFSAGPPLVAAALGEQVSKEDLGGARLHTATSGVAHNRAATEDEAFELARSYLAHFPSNSEQSAPERDDGDDCDARATPQVLDIVPRDHDKPYDMKSVISEMVDNGEFLELQPDFGRSMLTGLVRLGGNSCAIVANQPAVLAGAIDRAAADKANRFLRVVGAYRIPVIFLADNPGVLPGSAAEADGTLLAAARMYEAQAALRAAKLHVTLRKAFGFGSSLMAMNPFDDQTLTLAFPGATLGGLPAAGGADAAQLDASSAEATRKAETDACWSAADSMAYDEIIEPAELRKILINGLAASRYRMREPS